MIAPMHQGNLYSFLTRSDLAKIAIGTGAGLITIGAALNLTAASTSTDKTCGVVFSIFGVVMCCIGGYLNPREQPKLSQNAGAEASQTTADAEEWHKKTE